MAINIIIGNIISMAAAVFTFLGSVSRGRKKIYGYQVIQCAVMAVASVVFGSWSGVTTFALCGIRNAFAAYDRLTARRTVIIAVLVGILGIISNNRGAVGLIPVIATIIYTAGSFALRSERKIKLNIALNLVLWAIYDLIIMDYVSAAIDFVTAAVTMVSFFRTKTNTDA